MYFDVPIYERSLLKADDQLTGPCIISEMDSNTFVNPIHKAEIDEVGNILIWPVDSMATSSASELASVDPIIVQLVEAALQNTRLEMDVLIQRVAMSPAMREQVCLPVVGLDSSLTSCPARLLSYDCCRGWSKLWKDGVRSVRLFHSRLPTHLGGAYQGRRRFLNK